MIWENIKLALKDMMASKMRTLLSLLGIVIGVASVIAILTLGQSATKSITQTIVEGGLEMVTIFPVRSEKAANEFTEDFGERLVANVSDIKTVLPVNSSTATIRIGQNSLSATVTGVLSSYAEILDYEVSEGAFFSLSDNMANRQVVVLGSDIAEELFPDGNAIGEYVSIFRNQAKKLPGGRGHAGKGRLVQPPVQWKCIHSLQHLCATVYKTHHCRFVCGPGSRWGRCPRCFRCDHRIPRCDCRIRCLPCLFPGKPGRYGRADHRYVQFVFSRDRSHIATGRWNRDHEYHAGLGRGTHP